MVVNEERSLTMERNAHNGRATMPWRALTIPDTSAGRYSSGSFLEWLVAAPIP